MFIRVAFFPVCRDLNTCESCLLSWMVWFRSRLGPACTGPDGCGNSGSSGSHLPVPAHRLGCRPGSSHEIRLWWDSPCRLMGWPGGWSKCLRSVLCVSRRGSAASGHDAQRVSGPVVSERRSLSVLLDLTTICSHPPCEFCCCLICLTTVGLPVIPVGLYVENTNCAVPNPGLLQAELL